MHLPRETMKEARFLLAALAEKRLGPRQATSKRRGGLEKRKFKAFRTWTNEGATELSSGRIQNVEPGGTGDPGMAGTTNWWK